MKLMPRSSREWSAFFALPFKAYIILAAPAIFLWGSMVPRHTYVADIGAPIVLGYFFSGGGLIATGLIELLDKRTHRSAVLNLIFGAVGVYAGFWIAPYFASA
jgi:hypothetical protein